MPNLFPVKIYRPGKNKQLKLVKEIDPHVIEDEEVAWSGHFVCPIEETIGVDQKTISKYLDKRQLETINPSVYFGD